MVAERTGPESMEMEGRTLSADEHRRKEMLLTQPEPAKVRQTTDAVVLKHGSVFLLANNSGDIPWDHPHGYGLFSEDCRFLDGYALTINDETPVVLSYVDARGFETQHDLANPRMKDAVTGKVIEKNTIALHRDRFIRAGVLHDRLLLHNYGSATANLRIDLRFRARFEDIFVIKGFVEDRGHEPEIGRVIGKDAVELRSAGQDGHLRTTALLFSPAPHEISPDYAHFDCGLEPGGDWEMRARITAVEWPQDKEGRGRRAGRHGTHSHTAPASRASARRWLERSERIWLAKSTAVETSNPLFNSVIKRSLLDLQMLRSRLDGLHYFAAGIPWFATLFGRDACVTAIQTMPFGHVTAGETLQLLARYQASTLDPFRDAEPGKILHEYRTGELAQTGYIPQSPAYYGTVDATLLFLILMAEYVNWSGDLALARKLKPNIDAALSWIDNYADHDGDGYLDYVGSYETGLINQGWKDAGNSIPNADGSPVEPPVAVCEVQSYLYRAWLQTACLLRSLDEPGRAEDLEQRAADLQTRFENDFWSEELGCYVLALQKGGRPASVVSSNAGQVLWGGIASPERAARVTGRLMQPDMFSGWGIRTLSSNAKAYNPISYHLGSVWPHDNSLIIAGLERYGHDEAALDVFSALFDAASNMRDYRMPELYCGYARREGEQHPVGFPVACSPQAWAAGAIPHALWTLLGLRANATQNRLRIVRPALPGWLDRLELRRIQVGEACLNLEFRRQEGGPVEVDFEVVRGDVEVEHTSQIAQPGVYT